MTHSFARRPEDLRAERAESRRRVLICVGTLVAIAAGMVLWHYLAPYLRTTPQPTEPRKITVDGQEKLVSMSLSRGLMMSGSPPFRVTICTDGTIVFDVEDLRGDRWESVQRTTERATPEQLARLETAFVRLEFMSLGTAYTREDLTDCGWYSIYRYDAPRWKLVRYYSGDTSAPKTLALLVKEFSDTLPIDRWLPESERDLRPESAESR